jgi:PucR family transcriptional regulator, purine catabolism regulatory protein
VSRCGQLRGRDRTATLQTIDTLVHQPGREPDADAEREGGLRRAFAVQLRLAQEALDGEGLDAVTAAVAAEVDGSVLVIDAAGRPLARHDPSGVLDDEVAGELGRALAARSHGHPLIVDHPALPAGAYARPIASPRAVRARAWLVVATAEGRIDEPVRLVVQQAATIVGLELMHRGARSETERRLTANLVGDAIEGRTDPAELDRQLQAFGVHGEVAIVLFTGAGPAAERALQEVLAASELAAAVSIQKVEGRELLCAIVEVGVRDPIEVAAAARIGLVDAVAGARAGEIVAAVSRARPAADLPRAFQEACWALEAVEHKSADTTPTVGSWRDLGVESLLLSVADGDALHLYCDQLLGPVLAGDSVYAAELLRSLEVFILHNGQWERAARELHCHRHTLRYRMRKLEELTGRDLASATDRIEFWLALRARELSWSHRAR